MSENNTQKSGHGGARKGSGRQPKNLISRKITISMKPDLWEKIESYAASQSKNSNSDIKVSTIINKMSREFAEKLILDK